MDAQTESALIAVITTLLIVGTIFGFSVWGAWRTGKRWFRGFKDIRLKREDGTVHLDAKVYDQDPEPSPTRIALATPVQKPYDVREDT